jgi:hypothetical protein
MNRQIKAEIYNKISSLLELAYDPNSSLLSVMRQAATIATLAEENDLISWIEKEINGYTILDSIPSYRVISSIQVGESDFYISSDIKSLHKSDFLQKIKSYNFMQGVPHIESYISQGGVWFRGDTIKLISGKVVWNKITIRASDLKILSEHIKQNLISKLQKLINILTRFNDYRKYASNPINNEAQLNGEVYKILKPVYPDLIDEEYLNRSGTKNPKVDFAVPSLRLLIESKYITKKEDLPAIQEQLLADIPQYLGQNNEFDEIVVFIYSKVHIPSDFTEYIKSQNGIKDVIVTFNV